MNETNLGSQSSSADISYQVMPHSSANYTQTNQAPTPPNSHKSGSKLAYIIIAILVLALLGGLAYYFLGFGKKTTETETPTTQTSKLPASFLATYFASDTCTDQSTCGDNVDVENDGLTNYQEFVAGTSPLSSDTDADGLADGDEVNIYATLPKNKYTDTRLISQQNDFTDGRSILNGYDPNTEGVKFTETRLAAIKDKITQFGLHEPTMTTLGLNADGSKVFTPSN